MKRLFKRFGPDIGIEQRPKTSKSTWGKGIISETHGKREDVANSHCWSRERIIHSDITNKEPGK